MQRYFNKYTAIFTLTILAILFTLPNISKAGSISLPPNNLGLVGYWSMEDGAGTTATDFSGNGNTGTLTNMDDTDWVDGKFGKALSFDGVDDEISASDSLLPMGNSARSVSVWIKTTVTGEKYFVRWGVNSPNTAFAVGLRDGAVIATQYGGGKTSSVVLNDDRWHHVVFVWDETTAYIYIQMVYLNLWVQKVPGVLIHHQKN